MSDPDPTTRHAFLLDAASVEDICPVGAARSWDACRRVSESEGVVIPLLAVPPAIARRLRHHPLLEYASGEDDLFADPYSDAPPSCR